MFGRIKKYIVLILYSVTLYNAKASEGEQYEEIGIVLTVPYHIQTYSKEVTNQCFELLKASGLEEVEDLSNTPHISLFQMNIDTKDIHTITNILEEIASAYSSPLIQLDQFLTDTQENIFWNATTSKTESNLVNLHKEVVNRLKQLKAEQPMQQVLNEKKLTPEQQERVKEYGIFWGLPGINFNPHITLFYNSGKNRSNGVGDIIDISSLMSAVKTFDKNSVNLTFNSPQLAIAKLGYYGNVIEIIKQFEFKASN